MNPSRPDVVFDCNVILQAFARAHGPAVDALRLVEQNTISLHLSRPILRELRRVLSYPEVRQKISPRKADGETWLDIHRTAHRLGLKSNATMLFGHVEEVQHRVDHLLRLRALQDETGGFQTFIALPFHPARTAFRHLPRPSAFDCLRTIAVSRLLLDNFDHIKAYWVALGLGLAQAALDYGADDLDGTVRYENIYHDAGADSPDAVTVDELCGLIREAGREPVERDSLYRRVRRLGRQWEVEE